MLRLFEQHRIRKSVELEGMWDFYPEGKAILYRLPVPGCWEQHPDLYTYRGKGTYVKKVYVAEPGTIRLEFKGVSHTAQVYFDQVPVTCHYNAFTPFSAVVKEVERGEHEIRVAVDNSFGEQSALHIPNDYYTYGGITRPVAMEQISGVYIERVHFTPLFEHGIWSGRLTVCIHNTTGKKVSVNVKSTLEQYTMNSDAIELEGESKITVTLKQQFEDVIPWSNHNPKLYLIHTILYTQGQPADDLIERVGFRTVAVNGTKLQVNGEEVFLKGFNRHEDYAAAGCAIPLQLMVQDMELMLDMGVNALRTSHYPNDERFLDLCDERGILVWEENHARGLSAERMQNPNFDQQCEDCIREMIENHYNHPSIILWGILNECASYCETGRRKYKTQYEQIRTLDDTRPATSATCHHFKDITLDLPDIVSINVYSGWYTEDPAEEKKNEILSWIRQSGGENKPIIVSEFGAGAMYGYRDRSRCKWSEERQADIIEENLKVYMKDKNISGVFIWQFADCRVTEEEWFASRPRCHNNKGVVDEYRRPKLAYDVVKKYYEELR